MSSDTGEQEDVTPQTTDMHDWLGDDVDPIDTAEKALKSSLAVKTLNKQDKSSSKKLAKIKQRIDSDDTGKPTTAVDFGEDVTLIDESSKALKRQKQRVRFLLEIRPDHAFNKIQPLSSKIPPPPPPPPPVPAGFFEKLPTKSTQNLPPIPRRLPPPMPAVHFSNASEHSSHSPKVPPPPPAPPSLSELQPREPIFTPAVDGDLHINKKAFRLYTKFMNEITEFVELQNSVTRKRIEVQEKRMYLKLQRDYIHLCNMRLFAQLQLSIANGDFIEDDVSPLLEESQKARNDIVSLEDHYEAAEVELGAEEWALKEKLGMLQYRYESFFRLHGASISTVPAQSEAISFDSTSSSEAHEDEGSTKQQRYRTTLGDAVPVGGAPTALIDLQSQTVVETTARESHRGPKVKGVNGSSDTLSFPKSHISSFSATVSKHTEAGHIYPRDQEVPIALTGIGFGPLDDEQMNTWNAIAGAEDPSFFYEHPNNVLEEMQLDSTFTDGDPILLRGSDGDTLSTLSEYLVQFESTRDRVNKWLLHKLRVSPREVFELKRQVQSSDANVPDWANLVLQSWDTVGVGYEKVHTLGSDTATEHNERVNSEVQVKPSPFPPTATSHKTRSSGTRRHTNGSRRSSKRLSVHLQPKTIDLMRKDIAYMEASEQIFAAVDPMLQSTP